MRLPPTRTVVRVAGALAFRAGCYAVMVWLALLAEARPVPGGPLPDAVLAVVPYVEAVDRNNYLLWLLAYLPLAAWLLVKDVDVFVRYTVTSGLLALARGVSLLATGLPAIAGGDAHAGMSAAERWDAWLRLTTPLGFFDRASGARVSLTKDLFFSGHTSTTFLLLLTLWRWPRARAVALVAHVVVVASVFLSHLHYTIDVVGAWAVTFAIYAAREWRPAPVVR